MPKIFENEITYNYNPVHTINHLFRKYPNPYAEHVHSVDTLSRTVDPETGVIRTERIIGLQQGAPRWITKLFQLPPTAYVREIVFVDPSTPSATMMSVNLSLAQYVSCLELITYTPSPSESTESQDTPSSSNQLLPAASFTSMFAPLTASADGSQSGPGWVGPGAVAPATLFSQRALIISGFPTSMIARRIEKASVDRFSKNAGVGRKGFEWVLNGGREPDPP